MALHENRQFRCCIQILQLFLTLSLLWFIKVTVIITICIFSSDCYHENGKNYRGMVRKTRKGITCQKWNVNTPHQTKYDDHLSVTKTNDFIIQKKQSVRICGHERMERALLVAFVLKLCPKSKLHYNSKQVLSMLCIQTRKVSKLSILKTVSIQTKKGQYFPTMQCIEIKEFLTDGKF